MAFDKRVLYDEDYVNMLWTQSQLGDKTEPDSPLPSLIIVWLFGGLQLWDGLFNQFKGYVVKPETKEEATQLLIGVTVVMLLGVVNYLYYLHLRRKS